LRTKLRFNRSSIRLGSPTAEIFHVEPGHTNIVPDGVHPV